ncbi:50S ribosomal protein L25 [Myxococcota bacterium]|nr:50S ribosomal protein L25 [Myxococcota bacterium]MBU1533699.1 50S ribosomal protein L25 [Myxococcota bacterium]
MELNKFKAVTRETHKKNANRKLRNQGMIPAILYGQGKPQISLTLDPKVLVASLDPEKKRNTYIELEVEGTETTQAIIRDVQFNHLSGKIIHVDFLRINPSDRITVTVPFNITGKSIGEKLGGSKRQVLREFSITCPVSIIPSAISYDISPMKIDDIARIQDLVLEEGIVINLPPRQAIVQVRSARGVKDEAAAEDEEETAGA